jgi:hypothetical protein
LILLNVLHSYERTKEMRLYALALTSVLLFPSQEEQARISKPYSECLQAVAERDDDGQADIAVIGKAVAAACKAEFDQMIVVLGERLSVEDLSTLTTSLSGMQIGYATAVVGEVRAQRRGPINR